MVLLNRTGLISQLALTSNSTTNTMMCSHLMTVTKEAIFEYIHNESEVGSYFILLREV